MNVVHVYSFKICLGEPAVYLTSPYTLKRLMMITRLLPRYGGVAVDHGVPVVEQHPRVWTKDYKVVWAKDRKTERICSSTVQNEIKDILGQVTTGAARRGLTSANSI